MDGVGWGGWYEVGWVVKNQPGIATLFRVVTVLVQETSTIGNSSRGLTDVSPPLGSNSGPYLLFGALHGAYCLSHYFIGSKKLAQEKQTNEL